MRRYWTNKLKAQPGYESWKGMVARCTNPNRDRWPYYGGANPPVKVCERWLNFDAFIADMGVRPKDTSLSRHLDTGDYEPGNCEWGTVAEQRAEAKGKEAMLALRMYHYLESIFEVAA